MLPRLMLFLLVLSLLSYSQHEIQAQKDVSDIPVTDSKHKKALENYSAKDILDSSIKSDEKRVIIIYKEQINNSDKDELKKYGNLKKEFKIIPGVSAVIKNKDMDLLKNNKRIAGIFEDTIVSATLSQSVPQIKANLVHSQAVTGVGSKVCIVDTGVSDSGPNLNPLVAEIDYASNPDDNDATDDNGHGTHVAGIVASKNLTYKGVAPGASLMAAKVLNSTGNGWTSDVMAGIDWCVANGADIISMSLGGGAFTTTCDAQPIAITSNNAVDAGVVVFAASGNNGFINALNEPACASKVIAVGAVDKFDLRTTYSNEGSELDVVSPGSSITSTVPTGICQHCDPSGFKSLTGTSMATPHASGTAALLLQTNPTLSPLEIKNILQQGAKDLGDPGFDTIFGNGRIDAYASYLIVPPIPNITINDITLAEGNSGTTSFVFTVTRSSNIGAISVDYSTADNTTNSSDYTAILPTAINFADGDALTQTISVLVNGDVTVESNETFSVNLSNCTGCNIADSQGVGTITNDDFSSGPQIFSDDFSLGFAKWTESGEGDWNTEIPAEKQVPLHTANLIAHSDDCDASCTIMMATPIDLRGYASANMTFWRYVDNDLDAGEYLKVELYNGSTWNTIFNWTNGAGDDDTWRKETVNLASYLGASNFNVRFVTSQTAYFEEVEIDDVVINGVSSGPVTPNITINDITLAEGNSGTTSFVFTVTRSSNIGAISVDYSTADNTTNSSDYTAILPTAINFADGDALTQTISVLVNGDVTVESNETFSVNLSNCTGCNIADSQGVGTITNDDSAPIIPNITINDITLAEGNSGTTSFVFTVTRSSNIGAISVDYSTADNTTNSSDYTAILPTAINFADGDALTQTISVLVNGDVTVESNETFSVNLSNCTGCNIADSQGVGTITNDDSAPIIPNITINDITLAEGNSGTTSFVFTVTRSSNIGAISVDYSTADNTTNSSDYTAILPTAINFADGDALTQTISVLVNGDVTVESNETFSVNLSNCTGCNIADSQGVGTITNDDFSSGPQIFSDDFSLGFAKWTESGEGDWNTEIPAEKQVPLHTANLIAHSDDCDASCTIMMATPIDLRGYASANMTFWRYVDNDLDAGEYLKVELYNGSTWNTIFNWTNGAGDDDTWRKETVNLASYLGASNFNVRFVTSQTAYFEEVEIDDVVINGVS